MAKAFKKCFTFFVAMVLALVCVPFVPGTTDIAEADVGLQDGTGIIAVNSTVIAFAGQEWWVIGYGGKGIYSSDTESATLFLKSTGNPYGDTAFDSSGQSTDYKDSTLQQSMVSTAGGFSAKEQSLINPRTLTASDDTSHPITGGAVADQLLWPISHNEWSAINEDTVRSFGSGYWMRSPDVSFNAWYAYDVGYVCSGSFVADSFAVRPALSLNLSSALFTSSATGGSGKGSVSVGDNLQATVTPTGTISLPSKTAPRPWGCKLPPQSPLRPKASLQAKRSLSVMTRPLQASTSTFRASGPTTMITMPSNTMASLLTAHQPNQVHFPFL